MAKVIVRPTGLELRLGATSSVVSGVWSIGRLCSSIVIDCRSRQAAHGPHDPGRIARAIVEGLASSCESIGVANARRKPDHGGKALRSVAGVACEGGQHTCRRKALRAGKSAPVDAGAVEAVLVLRGCSALAGRARGATGSVRGLVISVALGRKRRGEAAS
jgi:hypothetical protein